MRSFRGAQVRATGGHSHNGVWAVHTGALSRRRRGGPWLWRGPPGVETRWSGSRCRNHDSFLVVHAPGGYYALDLPTDVPSTSVFAWDVEAQEVVWTQEAEVFAQYDRTGQQVFGPPGARLVPLEIRVVVVVPWGGSHLLLHPDAGYGSLPEDFWSAP